MARASTTCRSVAIAIDANADAAVFDVSDNTKVASLELFRAL